VGLVAPSGGDDARADVETVLDAAGIETVEFRVAVTGPRAPILIAQALDRLALDPRPAATLLIRGGGPASDFVTFDDSLVGIAIDRHRHPVVTGLGHATNHTLADIAAHTTCITPTAAAHLVTNGAEISASGPTS
jgi:exodeoxyribonuclease VII large subunit